MICRSIHKDDEAKPGAPQVTRSAGSICQAQGCAREIPRGHLMCREHWFEVPVEARVEVEQSLAAWLGGKQGARPYLIARLQAIIYVGRLHRDDVGKYEAQLARLQEIAK